MRHLLAFLRDDEVQTLLLLGAAVLLFVLLPLILVAGAA